MPEDLLYMYEDDELEDALEENPVQDVVTRSLERARRYHEENIEPDLVTATEYYKGEPFGNEVKGKSKVVTTEVRDATLAMKPSLLRIFFGSENPVEYRGRHAEDQEMAAQATDYIRYVISEDNAGFVEFDSAITDALVRRLGIWKWWWDESERVEESKFSGLDEIALEVLAAEPSVEKITTDEQGITRVRRRITNGRARFMAVPPEEFIFDPGTRTIGNSPVVAHSREVPASDLIARGIDPDIVKRAQQRHAYIYGQELEEVRSEGESDWYSNDPMTLDPSQRPVLFTEAYVRVDVDDDGISELRLFECVGPDYRIVNGDGEGEVVDEVPFAVLTPIPEPHTLIGLSNYDLAGDVQLVKSQVLRATLDSLSEAVDPRTEVVAGEVNMHDLLNPETSKFIRVTRPGMMREVKHDFVGEDTLPILAYLDEVRENRTGQTKAAMGLDADSLQSSTKAAVAATLSASQQRIEMVARIFAETGVKQLFKGLLRLVTKHQDQPRVVRLRGKYVQVDPRHWDATMDVEVAVALGAGSTEEKLQIFATLAEKQELLLQHGAPIVSWAEYRHTLAKLLELSGIKNVDNYLKPWGPEEQAQWDQAQAEAAQNVPPDASAALVELEQMKAQAQIATDQAKLELERWKAQREDDRERDKIAREFELKRYELELKYQAQLEEAALRARVEADRAAQELAASQPAREGGSE